MENEDFSVICSICGQRVEEHHLAEAMNHSHDLKVCQPCIETRFAHISNYPETDEQAEEYREAGYYQIADGTVLELLDDEEDAARLAGDEGAADD